MSQDVLDSIIAIDGSPFASYDSNRIARNEFARKRGREGGGEPDERETMLKIQAELGVFVTLECVITLRGRTNKRDLGYTAFLGS